MAAGVDILQGSGRPNGESFGINIRGVGTMNNASPLVLVDGMEMSLSNVNPNDIESISILKDAASCAIYGNRGANGVIPRNHKDRPGRQGERDLFSKVLYQHTVETRALGEQLCRLHGVHERGIRAERSSQRPVRRLCYTAVARRREEP